MNHSKELCRWQSFVDSHIPIVAQMKLCFKQITDSRLFAEAPLDANINDKGTVFGGSSAALMTVCGWSLIKFNLEQRKIDNDVVICSSKLRWARPQHDDLQIEVSSNIQWQQVIDELKTGNQLRKIQLDCRVIDKNQKTCTKMNAEYAILPKV